ncbi:HAMP domain-containing histidine kinase [bacterium]|nr:HAMP domain-containing histidine kinase [bacterium]
MNRKKKLIPGITSGTVKAVIFIILIGIAIVIWIYTQFIFNQVREFQKSVVRTQIAIYVSVIDPTEPDTSNLFDYVRESPIPRIISDNDLNPIQGFWQNVGISPDKSDEQTYRKLRTLLKKMDEINPPESFPLFRLEHHIDTLTVYEYPPSRNFPIAITDSTGAVFYSRNIPVDSSNVPAFQYALNKMDAYSPPMFFFRDKEPALVFHGINAQRIWPVLVTNQSGKPLYWNDISVAHNDTTAAGNEKLESFAVLAREQGITYDIVVNYDLVVTETCLFHYGDVPFLSWIGWLPVIEFAVLLILLWVGFIGFKNITNAEQRSIWVGMAKETAHQLGTPISSLGGWLELLRTEHEAGLIDQAVPEMEYDVERLTRVAARFSSIGSKPELQPIELSDVLDEVLDYFRARVPRMGRSISIEGHYSGLSRVMGNHELLNWAFENLIKNSLASIDLPEGLITVNGSMSKDFRHIILDFIDNGKGIPYADQKKIMKPGFTTKKRGWGLGLSLVKRIIDDYHNGKVFLTESRPGAGTTFRVIIPAVSGKESS